MEDLRRIKKRRNDGNSDIVLTYNRTVFIVDECDEVRTIEHEPREVSGDLLSFIDRWVEEANTESIEYHIHDRADDGRCSKSGRKTLDVFHRLDTGEVLGTMVVICQ